MAAIFILAGGMVGFASALLSMLLLNTSLLTALGIWSGGGLLVVILGLGISLLGRAGSGTKSAQIDPQAHRA